MKINKHWGGVCLAVVWGFVGITTIPAGGIAYGAIPIPAKGGWVLLAVAIIIGFISVRALLRGEGKEPEYTDEDIEKAKAKLEKMYMQEHGSRPEVPGEKPEAESTFEAKREK